MNMESEATYLVLDWDGFKIVVNSGGAQMTIAGPCLSVDEALRQAMMSRNGQPVAIRLQAC
jgi:hypothetical protein